MANPKLLQAITILTSNQDFAFTLSGAQSVSITLGDYGSIYEVAANFETQLQAVNANFSVVVSSIGIMTVSNSAAAWVVDWALTDNDLEDLFGYAGTEAVTGAGPYPLVATKRHGQNSQYPPWYSPVGERYQLPKRFKPRRVEATEDGDAATHTGSGYVKTMDLSFVGVLQSALEPMKATTSDDGSGGTIDWTDVTFADWWLDVADKKFRFYFRKEDGTVGGTVAAPGTEGTDYFTCVRLDEENEPDPLDPDGFTYFNVTIPIQITGG